MQVGLDAAIDAVLGLTDSPWTLGLVFAVAASWATLTLFVVEAVVGWMRGRQLYDVKDTLSNITLYWGYVAITAVWSVVVLGLYQVCHAHAPVKLVSGVFHTGGHGLWWEWVLLVVLEDLCFYVFHRCSHRVRLLWASHVTHHSSLQFNFSVAFRQTWQPFFAVVFWLPLPLLGFDPLMVLCVQFGSLTYQEFLHTQLVGGLGPLEWVFNTPQHHAVHHGRNAAYVDKNYGGVLIIWDRLFGTFADVVDGDPVEFGLTDGRPRHHPWVAAWHAWGEMVADVVRAGSLRDRWTAVWGPPPPPTMTMTTVATVATVTTTEASPTD